MAYRFASRTLFLAALVAGLQLGPARVALAQAANHAAIGHSKFTQRKYDEAIDAFRRHLQRAPKDYNIWNQLGAAYYHTGQPKKALRHLKHVQRLTADKSYNYYYQGLCYLATETPDRARQYLNYAGMRFVDEYAARALFEMALLEYKARNRQRTTYYATLYMQRYPTGVYTAQAGRLLQAVREEKWTEPIEGAKKPNMEEALFKYNKLSFGPKPHYWFLQGGGQWSVNSGQEPAPGGGIKSRNYETMGAIVNAGVGVGPWREGDMTAFGGYTYRQLWITDQDRIATYQDDFQDFEYFFLRGDLLERRHQFYADFRRDVANILYYGVFGRLEFARIGSAAFPSPETQELRKVLKISDTQIVIPWIGATYLDNMRTLAYFYLRKEINEDSPDHSNKTYDFGFKGGRPVVSLGISHGMDYPDLQLEVGIEAFHYEFIYNDLWLDYTRNGFLVSVEHEFIPRWIVSGALGYYNDSYILDRIKLKPCGTGIESPNTTGTPTTDPTTPRSPATCDRNDTGLMYQAGIMWNWTQFQRLTATLTIVENRNPKEREFEESRQSVQVTYTMAFPSVKRVSRFVDRYADSAFTKEAE